MSLTSQDLLALRLALSGNPRALEKLDPEEQMAAARAVVAIEDDRYERDPYAWATEMVVTQDEAAGQLAHFPDKAYLHDYFDALKAYSLIAVPKSRRMLVTWATALYMAHEARYLPHFAGYVQSDTETKAAFVVDQRIKFIEDNLPPVYRRQYKENKTVGGLVGTVTWTGTGSFTKGIAQGKDGFRAYTPTFVFMDEIEFQQQGHQSFVAALPFAEKKCKIVIVSSSGGPSGVIAGMAREAGFKRFA